MGGNVEKAAEWEDKIKRHTRLENLKKKRYEDLVLIFEEVSDFVNTFDDDSLLTGRQHDLLEEVKIMLYSLGF